MGIDVGKGRICLVQRRAGSTPILEAIQSFSIPETMDWETPGLADRIREALSAFLPHGGRDADIWVRLPDGQDELRHYRIPKVSPKDRDAIANMAAIREKPFDEAENIFDYRVDAEVLDKGVPRLPVTAMIANKGAVNTVRHTLAAAGVSPAGITSGNIYAQNLFASGWLSSPWEHFAFADIGEDSTRIEIFSGTNITLSRTIKTGLRSLVTALQESYGGGRKKTPPPPVVPPMPRHLPMEALGGELAGSHSERQQAVSSFTSPSDPFPLILQPESLPLELSLPQLSPMDMDMASAPVAPSVPAASLSSLAEKIPDDEISYEEGLHLLCENRRRTPEEEESLLLRLSQPLGRLARQLERTADHFRNAMGMPNIQGVIVFAPGGCMALALKKFETSLGLPCRPLRFDGQTTPGAATDLEKALARSADESLLQAIGLSLSAPAYTPNAIMTYKDQKSRERQMRITFLSIGLTTVVLMLLLAFCGKLYMGYLDEKAHKAELESRIASWPVALHAGSTQEQSGRHPEMAGAGPDTGETPHRRRAHDRTLHHHPRGHPYHGYAGYVQGRESRQAGSAARHKETIRTRRKRRRRAHRKRGGRHAPARIPACGIPQPAGALADGSVPGCGKAADGYGNPLLRRNAEAGVTCVSRSSRHGSPSGPSPSRA